MKLGGRESAGRAKKALRRRKKDFDLNKITSLLHVFSSCFKCSVVVTSEISRNCDNREIRMRKMKPMGEKKCQDRERNGVETVQKLKWAD